MFKFDKFMLKTTLLFFLLLNNCIAINKNYSFWCTGDLITTKTIHKEQVKKEKVRQQIIFKNSRLFIPGMMLLCNQKSHKVICSKKRLDSIWEAKLDLDKKTFWYYSKNVTLNKTQNFTSTCVLKK